MTVLDKLQRAIESLYNGVCTISEIQTQPGRVNNGREVIVYDKLPCRLVYKTQPAASEKMFAGEARQQIKLFLATDIKVKAGSQITVVQNGVTSRFINSGRPAVYSCHQEIELVSKEDWV